MTNPSRRLPRSKQNGIALVVALLVVAIVAGLTLLFTERQQMWMRQLENRNNFTLATTSAFSAINMARLTLRDDYRRNQVDYESEPWTIPIPPISVETGQIAGHLEELNGRFNLLNLLSGTTVDASSDAVKRAASGLGVSKADLVKVLQATADVIKAEPNSTPELEEAILRANISADSRASLLKHAIILPETTAINVNFADAEALQAAIAGLTSANASDLIAKRSASPFLTLASFQAALPANVKTSYDSSAVSIQSTYFLIQVNAWFNNIHMGYESMLLRTSTDLPTIVWTRRTGITNS